MADERLRSSLLQAPGRKLAPGLRCLRIYQPADMREIKVLLQHFRPDVE
ncbi:hypothetical protein [Rhizobium leguminosarum]|nr:hypothetical protein [Rhizobium leguminosarum]